MNWSSNWVLWCAYHCLVYQTLNKWEAIKYSLHFSKNEERQEANDDPLVTHLTSKVTSIPMGEKVVVEEQMFRSRNRLKQYLPAKLKK